MPTSANGTHAMGRGNDFRGQGRRDDWDRQPEAPAFARPSYGAPAGGGAPFQSRRNAGPTDVRSATGRVKWYKADKGFGFVQIEDGTDAFLHARALEATGHADVPPGATLTLTVGTGQKGAQVVTVTSVDLSTAEQPGQARPGRDVQRGGRRDEGPTTQVAGVVKWYDPNKGFGFVQADDGGKDVFVHVSALQASGLFDLAEGQRVTMEVRSTPKGREASSLRLG